MIAMLLLLVAALTYQPAPETELYGNCRITFYCNCEACCGEWSGGPTASGAMPTANHTVAAEACADRAAVSNALRDVIASNTANTQAILDKLCQQELETVKTENQNLRTQLNMANLAASQTAQNAFIANEINQQNETFYNRLATCPIPSMPVYGQTPIFNCNANNGCGCGCGVA